MAKQSSVNLDITNNADGFDISGGTTVRKLGITGGDVTIAGSGSATVTFPTTSTTIAGLGITQSFSALQSFSAGISASGATFSGNISAPNIVTSVNGATGSVTTYAGTTGNIQVRYGSGITATNYFSLALGNLGQITDVLTLSGATVGFDEYYVGNNEALGLEFERGVYGVGIEESGGVAISAKGIYDDGSGFLSGANLYLRTPASASGSSIIFRPTGNDTFIVGKDYVQSNAQHIFINGINSQQAGYTNNFAGPITGVTATFTGLLSASKGISAAGGVTFSSAISVDLIKIGRGAGGNTSNVAIGNGYDGPNLQFNTTGEQNTAIGYDVLPYNTTGNYNVGVGTSALEGNDSGSDNTAVGNSTLVVGTGSENTAVGAGALSYASNNQNTAIGYLAGSIRGTGFSTRTSGTGGIFIGYKARASGQARTNEIVIGTNALGLGSNTAVIGATSQTSATIYGTLNVIGGISASDGFTFGSLSGTTWIAFVPKTSCTNGGLWIKDGNLQLSGSALGSGQGTFSYSPCGEQFVVTGYSTFQNSHNYQSGRSPLRLNGAPTQSVPIFAAYKQTSDGAQLTNTFTTTNMVAGIDENGALFSTVGVCAAGATFSGLIRANAGISASGITVGGSISLQNQEFIRNTTNGRMDFMPAPAGSTHYGMYMDFTSWEYGTKLGTIRASDGSLNAAGFLFEASITIGNNVRTSLGNNGQNGIVLSDTGNDTIQLYTSTTSGTNSGAIAIVDLASVGAANRSPGVTHTNPNLYVYRSGTVRANDFIRMEHDGTVGRIVSGGTSGISLEPGSGVVGISGGISLSAGITFADQTYQISKTPDFLLFSMGIV